MNKKIGIKQEERGIPFEFIKDNVQTIGELRELSEKIGFYKKERTNNFITLKNPDFLYFLWNIYLF